VSDARIEVRLQPRARRDELVGMRDGVLIARVCAPPVDGEANRALCRLIARRVGVAPTLVTIVSGARGRSKLVSVTGFDRAGILAALAVGEAGD